MPPVKAVLCCACVVALGGVLVCVALCLLSLFESVARVAVGSVVCWVAVSLPTRT